MCPPANFSLSDKYANVDIVVKGDRIDRTNPDEIRYEFLEKTWFPEAPTWFEDLPRTKYRTVTVLTGPTEYNYDPVTMAPPQKKPANGSWGYDFTTPAGVAECEEKDLAEFRR